ncbi:hypothetical protein FD754_006048 [Muntiacus muntjak]|uniref:Delta-sarcoglycan n=1 Tax=Muntiacus muntjak TaxID=9888 RepID=A0A5N3WJB1_MUNMU|nr:hypothetical protein FD754_006048 [Muntiacus muntjak]
MLSWKLCGDFRGARWGVGRMFKREGLHVYIKLIHLIEGVGWGIFATHKGVTSQGKGGLREKLKPVLSRGLETSGTQTWEMEENPFPKVCSVLLCLFFCPAYRVIITIFLNSIYITDSNEFFLTADPKSFYKHMEVHNYHCNQDREQLESPTRSLVMEAPKGVEINAEAGNMEATCRTELRLESKDGEIKLDAAKIKLPRLPRGSYTPAGARQKVFEICVCANGRLFLSQAGAGSTCQINTSVCL